jgi:hypothetical protein
MLIENGAVVKDRVTLSSAALRFHFFHSLSWFGVLKYSNVRDAPLAQG